MSVELQAAPDRYHTDFGWLDSRHNFSFGHHYDPTNTGHGLLIVSNDDRVAPGAGFGNHGHRDMEIVTWVLDGALEHRDSAGNHGIITPGLAQRMSAGRGIIHSEMNHSSTEPVHFVQMWVVPDTTGIEPSYEQLDVTEALDRGGLVAVASGRGHPGAVRIHQAGAVMWVARLDTDTAVSLPDAPFVHVLMARGSASLDGVALSTGDAARLTNVARSTLRVDGPGEIIVWESAEEVVR